MIDREPQMRAPVLVRAADVAPLLEVAAARGVNVRALLGELQIPPAVFAEGRDLPLSDYFRLQNGISAALHDETFRMSARQLLPGTTDFVLAHLSAAASLAEAMKILANSYNLLHGGEFNSVRRRGDVMTFAIDDRRFPYTQKDNRAFLAFSIECVQIFLHSILATLSRPHANAGLRRVSVTRPSRGDALHLDFWGTPIRFGAAVYALDYSYDAATAAIAPPGAVTAAEVYAEIAAASANAQTAGQGLEATDFVRRSLARGVIDQTRIAALAGVSAATLRRRLEAEGTSFRDLKSEVLNEAAKSLLLRRRTVAEVAEELGFSELRAFNRAFRSWNGVTPTAFAQRARAGSD